MILVEIDNNDILYEPLGLTVGELKGTPIVDSDGERLGSVDDVFGDADGVVVAVAVDVGGVLGIGSRKLVLPLDQLTMSVAENTFAAPVRRAALEALPAWN